MLKKGDDLLERVLGLVLASDVLEGDARLLALDLLGARAAQSGAKAQAAAKIHGRPVVAHGLLEPAVEQPCAPDEDDEWQHVDEEVEPHVGVRVGNLGHHLDLVLLERAHE